jgi:hypothetical protein
MDDKLLTVENYFSASSELLLLPLEQLLMMRR